ncbi:MAG: hypothetical protein IJT87_06270 [Ruminiclostridium sp.]|nr:hypothetical protein [Ruminiclostridium sp.]
MNDKLTLQLFAFDCNDIPASQHDNAVKAIKKFGAALRATGRQQNVSGTRFTRSHDLSVVNTPLEKFRVKELADSDGSGACVMLDRTADLMDKVGVRLANTPEEERPSQVFLTIVTFGRDNASTKTTYEKLHDMIAHQSYVYKWKFFLMTDFSINMEKLGIPEENTVLIKKTEKNWFSRPFEELTEIMLKNLSPER